MNDKWIKLDNAAKIFPATVQKSDTKVFRFSCELTEDVDPEILQTAVNAAAEIFTVYNYILKRGFFWYYLERSDLKPVVREEYKPVCASLYYSEYKGLLYEVTYYKNRINVEFFHALSDGTGALKFLEFIVCKYVAAFKGIPEPENDYDASEYEKEDDSFYRYYDERKDKKESKGKHRKAYQAKFGTKYSDDRLSLITGQADVKGVLTAAHECGVTMTAYLTAAMLCAINETMPKRAKNAPVVITVPINLRKHFPSSSARNFFTMANISYNFKKSPGDFASVANYVSEKLKQALEPENMKYLINRYSNVENNIFARIAPLILKDLTLRIAHDYKMKEVTGTLSNVGIAKLPPEIEPYVRNFGFCCGTNQIQACAVSFRDKISISFTSPYDDFDIQKNFFRRLTERGIHVEITSNTDSL